MRCSRLLDLGGIRSRFLEEFEGIIRSVSSEGKLVLETETGEQFFEVKELKFMNIANQ